MTDPVRLNVELNGAPLTLRDFDDLRAWQDREFEAWRFLTLGEDPWGSWNILSTRLDELVNAANNVSAQGQPITALGALFAESYGEGRPDAAIFSESELGRQVLKINDLRGPAAASFGYAFAKKRIGLQNARSPDDLAAGMMLAMPDLIRPDELAERHKLERQNDRRSVAKVLDEIADQAVVRDDQWRDLQTRLRARYLRWMIRGARRISTTNTAQTVSMREAIDRITATDAAYKEAMRLKAPVDYWTKKAATHQGKEINAQWRVVWFFGLLIPAMAGMFFLAGWFVLREKTVAPQLYVVAGAGLATITGTLFWVGRLLTRLYLSEHHLRHDAEERAVMTETYLALTHEQAAQETDRHIVLTALFRSTPDGIVKDDGPLDASLPSLVARLAGGKA